MDTQSTATLPTDIDLLELEPPTTIELNPQQEEFIKFADSRVYDEEENLVGFDGNLRNKLVQDNARLVSFVIDKFYNKTINLPMVHDDLLQEGYIGLMESIPRYEPSMGYKFSTYCIYWIRHQINEFLLKNKTSPGVPSHVRIAYSKLLKESRRTEIRLKDLIQTNPNGIKELGITAKMLNNIKASMETNYIVSLEDPCKISSSHGGSVRNDSGDKIETYGDHLESENQNQENIHDNQRLVEACKKVLNTLSTREKTILLLRYKVIDQPLTMMTSEAQPQTIKTNDKQRNNHNNKRRSSPTIKVL